MAAPNRVVQSNMECMQTEKPRPIVLLSSFDRWETWGWKGKHSTELLPRNRGLSWDSNTARYNSKSLTPSYQICCLVPLCRLVASPTYHFSMRQSSKWDSEFLCVRWCWLHPFYLHSDSHQRASPKCLGFYPWAFQKDYLLTLLLGLDDASLKLCLYSVFTTQQVRGNSWNSPPVWWLSAFSVGSNSE